ncbi:hypothetical protein ACG9XL_17055 [Acinetobacter nosocomialis]|nr:hypothetical protein [Acinetobacter baumannii]MDC5567255.1 hypothetical protein [Acinetobacter baumannii]MDI9759671.1 hypothetical protein [Acinetobacter baumannii]MDK2172881.1 hypothetical protein [Acinetobacter baumannii]MDK2183667.1 hypothetical protein [Acinetobacter baumannii]MDK2329491.1 hypothetical protein [Acinetobacter baumannii]
MSGKSYDPLVWFLLREVWQAVPKITWANLCELVAEATKLPTPSPDSVRKKSTAEKWRKNIRSYCRKADKTLSNVKCRLLDELYKEYEKLQKDRDEMLSHVDGTLLPGLVMPTSTFSILDDIAYTNRKTVTVLQEHRRRSGKIGQLLDDAMDWMYQAKEAVLAPGQTPEQVEKAQKQFNLLEAMTEKIEIFSRTSKNLMQMDFLLFGINTDDTRDSDTQDRVSAIQDESVFAQAKRDLEEQYELMHQQSIWIESGEFESEVIKEMEEKQRQEDAEDAEFFEVEEDED